MLLISLGTERAAQVFKHLRDDEIEALSLEMAKLQRVDPGTSDSVLEELAATVTAYDSLNAGGVDYAREVLERALGPEPMRRFADELAVAWGDPATAREISWPLGVRAGRVEAGG